MNMQRMVLLAFIFLNISGFANVQRKGNVSKNIYAILKIIQEQPDAIEGWIEDRVYITPSRIAVTYDGVFLHHRESIITLPSYVFDEDGIFVRCENDQENKEAQEHYNKAKEALLDAIGHSFGAGISIDGCPPLALYEGYKAIQSWKEAAKEYNAGVECEQRGTYSSPEPNSSRDRD